MCWHNARPVHGVIGAVRVCELPVGCTNALCLIHFLVMFTHVRALLVVALLCVV